MKGGRKSSYFVRSIIIYIRVFVLVIINSTSFGSSWTVKGFLISLILWAGCNEIESNIVNCRMSYDEKNKKKKVKIRTQNEKSSQ